MTNNDLAKALNDIRQELREGQKGLQDQVSEIKTTLDELSGAKRVMVWLAGTIIAVGGIVVAFLDLVHRNKP